MPSLEGHGQECAEGAGEPGEAFEQRRDTTRLRFALHHPGSRRRPRHVCGTNSLTIISSQMEIRLPLGKVIDTAQATPVSSLPFPDSASHGASQNKSPGLATGLRPWN